MKTGWDRLGNTTFSAVVEKSGILIIRSEIICSHSMEKSEQLLTYTIKIG